MRRSFGMLEDGRNVEAITLGERAWAAGRSAHLRRDPAAPQLSGARRAPRPHPPFRSPRAIRTRSRLRRLAGGPFRQSYCRRAASNSTARPPGHGQRRRRIICMAARWDSANASGACWTSPRAKHRAWFWAICRPTVKKGIRAMSRPRSSWSVKPNALSIILSARSDAATPINLTYHPYFNLQADPHQPATEQ